MLNKAYDILLKFFIITMPVVAYGISAFGVSFRLSRIFILALFPLIIIRVFNNLHLIKRDKFFIYGFLPFFAYSLCSILWTPIEAKLFGYNRLGALFEVIIVYIAFIVGDFDTKKFKEYTNVYLASSFIPLLFAFWQIANNIFRLTVAELPFQDWFIPGKYEIFKDRNTYFIDGGYSRLSSCFAEPTIFGSFLSSVFLLSLTLEPVSKTQKILLRFYQLILAICIILSLSKMAFITLLFGLIIIYRNHKTQIIKLFFGFLLFFGLSVFLLVSLTGNDFILRRLFTDSGHLSLIFKTFELLKSVNLITGEGIGSIPGFSTNKFLLSRLYETGLVGLIFTIFVSLIPFKDFLINGKNYKQSRLENVYFGLGCTIIFGFHIYDNFIYLWPWIILGISMSHSLNSKHYAL